MKRCDRGIRHTLKASIHTRGYIMKRLSRHHETCATSDRMAPPKPRFGGSYGGMFHDTHGDPLVGEKSYVMRIKPDKTEELLWAVTVYETDNLGLINTDQHRADIGFAHETTQVNDDGSTYIFVGPEPPKGWEFNWIKSVPGRGWFPYLHLYFPTEEFLEQSWPFPKIFPVDFSDYAK